VAEKFWRDRKMASVTQNPGGKSHGRPGNDSKSCSSSSSSSCSDDDGVADGRTLKFSQWVLTSNNQGTAENYDANLINPYAIVGDGHCFWVSANSGDRVIRYNADGVKQNEIIVSRPTGIAYSCGKSRKKGHCCGTVFIGTGSGAIYQASFDSLAMTSTLAESFLNLGIAIQSLAYWCGKLYITSSGSAQIRIFNVESKTELNPLEDQTFNSSNSSSSGYVPYGLMVHNSDLYMTLANTVPSVGNGYLDLIRLDHLGTIYRLASRGPLQMPYGIALVKDRVWVGSSGSGEISIYDVDSSCRRDKGCSKGELKGCVDYRQQVVNRYGAPLVNDGIMGLWHDAKTRRVYFVAANDDKMGGSFGYIALNDRA
jgi:hypothetical protein